MAAAVQDEGHGGGGSGAEPAVPGSHPGEPPYLRHPSLRPPPGLSCCQL